MSQWAGEFRYLSQESSADACKWYNERAPHLVKPMDCLSATDPCQQVVLKFSSQSGKTEVLNNFVGYIIDQDPGPTLVVQPTLKPMGEAWSKDRLAPMVRDCPTLREKVGSTKSRDSNNTIAHKVFPGGHVSVSGSNSPASLASRPIRYLACDEFDRYEVTKEGDPGKLAEKRTLTYHNRKILKTSSPTFPNVGIDNEYENSLQHQWQLKCLHCDVYQFPQFKHFTEIKTDDPKYVCEHCGCEHTLKDEFKIKRSGKWFVMNEHHELKKGFWFNQWSSPFTNWRSTLDEFLDAKDHPHKLQTVVNTVFAETWVEQGETIDEHVLFSRREKDLEIPSNAVVVAGADVQDDRIELEVVAFGEGDESYSLDYKILMGDPAKPELWALLTEALRESYSDLNGTQLSIQAACIDSGGHHTQTVYDYCGRRPIPRIYAIKGVGGEGKPIVEPRQLIGYPHKRKAIIVGVDTTKSLLFSYLRQQEAGPGYCHFPMDRDAKYFDQLTAEKVVVKFRKGFPHREWVKVRLRNEALDCRVYAMAALKLLPKVQRRSINKASKVKAPQQQQSNTRRRERQNWFNR